MQDEYNYLPRDCFDKACRILQLRIRIFFLNTLFRNFLVIHCCHAFTLGQWVLFLGDNLFHTISFSFLCLFPLLLLSIDIFVFINTKCVLAINVLVKPLAGSATFFIALFLESLTVLFTLLGTFNCFIHLPSVDQFVYSRDTSFIQFIMERTTTRQIRYCCVQIA